MPSKEGNNYFSSPFPISYQCPQLADLNQGQSEEAWMMQSNREQDGDWGWRAKRIPAHPARNMTAV